MKLQKSSITGSIIHAGSTGSKEEASPTCADTYQLFTAAGRALSSMLSPFPSSESSCSSSFIRTVSKDPECAFASWACGLCSVSSVGASTHDDDDDEDNDNDNDGSGKPVSARADRKCAMTSGGKPSTYQQNECTQCMKVQGVVRLLFPGLLF